MTKHTHTGASSASVSSSVSSSVTSLVSSSVTSSVTPSTQTHFVLNSDISMSDIMARLAAIEERLLMLSVDEALHKQYPALAKAYRTYKTIEAMAKQGT